MSFIVLGGYTKLIKKNYISKWRGLEYQNVISLKKLCKK